MSQIAAKPSPWWPGIATHLGITRGLVFATPLWDPITSGSGERPLATDIITQTVATQGTANGAAWQDGEYGKQIASSATANTMPWWDIPQVNPPFSVMVFLSAGVSASDRAMILNDPSATTRGFSIGTGGASTTMFVQWIDSAGTTSVISAASMISATEDNVYIASLSDEGSNLSWCAAMCNGRVATASGFVSRAPVMTRVYLLRDGSTVNTWDGKVYCAAVWSRLLGFEEMRQLCADPFCLWRPRSRASLLSAGVSVAAGQPMNLRWMGLKHMMGAA